MVNGGPMTASISTARFQRGSPTGSLLMTALMTAAATAAALRPPGARLSEVRFPAVPAAPSWSALLVWDRAASVQRRTERRHRTPEVSPPPSHARARCRLRAGRKTRRGRTAGLRIQPVCRSPERCPRSRKNPSSRTGVPPPAGTVGTAAPAWGPSRTVSPVSRRGQSSPAPAASTRSWTPGCAIRRSTACCRDSVTLISQHLPGGRLGTPASAVCARCQSWGRSVASARQVASARPTQQERPCSGWSPANRRSPGGGGARKAFPPAGQRGGGADGDPADDRGGRGRRPIARSRQRRSRWFSVRGGTPRRFRGGGGCRRRRTFLGEGAGGAKQPLVRSSRQRAAAVLAVRAVAPV